MRQHLQSLLVAHEILEVIQDEDANALLGVRDTFQSRLEFVDDGGEGVFLNQEQQALFGLEVVIKPCQRHAGSTGKVAHGGAFVSLDAKHLGGMVENLPEAAVETGGRSRGQAVSAVAGGAGWGQSGHTFERSFEV